jgi:hypothetical protein
MPKEKLTDEWIDKKAEALVSLRNHWGWKSFQEVILYLQGTYTSRLFSKQYMELDPVAKDKEHRAIVEINNVLNRLLELPEWLLKRKQSTWQDVLQQITKEEKLNG